MADLNPPIILLILYAIMLAWFAIMDGPEYRRFKILTETRDRQHTYAKWLMKSLIAFGGGALAGLIWLGEQSTLWRFPRPFAPLMKPLRESLAGGQGVTDFLLGFAGAVIAGLVVTTLFLRLRGKRSSGKPRQIVVGDIQPLFPRNGAERFWCAILSLNAGLSEELFFRLACPLVLVLVFGNALLAFAIATLAFGLMHLYQGITGVIATTVVGAVMSGIYLATGDIWIVVILHAAIDLNGLLLMPYLAQRRTENAAQ